jgi:aspartate racemase
MNPIGIIGGIGPESTIDYYRLFIEIYQQRRPDGSYPALIINSVDLGQMIALVAANDLGSLEALLLIELERLARAGATIGLLAANTPHIVFEALRRASPLPLVSIVETTCAAAKARGFKRVGLFGTKFTMMAGFYQKVFERERIEIVVPDDAEQNDLHARYMGELVKGIFTPETRDRAVAIATRLQTDQGIEALILGGTELPLLLRGATGLAMPILDTTRIHVEHVVNFALYEESAPSEDGPPVPGQIPPATGRMEAGSSDPASGAAGRGLASAEAAAAPGPPAPGPAKGGKPAKKRCR